jgi:nitrogen fixation NifU-like protein
MHVNAVFLRAYSRFTFDKPDPLSYEKDALKRRRQGPADGVRKPPIQALPVVYDWDSLQTGREIVEREHGNLFEQHSTRYLEMALSTNHREIPAEPDGYGERTGECGDTIQIYLCCEGERIRHAAYDTDGCLNTNACANTVACMVEGGTIAEAWEISAERVIDELETLPAEEHHCAELAVGALYRALASIGQRS